MDTSIPGPVLHADRVHHDILRRIAFSRHLNPVNAPGARRAFLAGAEAPPFRYLPLVEADEILRALDQADPPRDHPAGALVGACIDGTRMLTRALRDRTVELFHAMNEAGRWYPDAGDLSLEFPDPGDDLEPLDVDARQVGDRLRGALADRGLSDWQVVDDTVMAARVLVDGAKRLLRINPRARFRRRDLDRLVVHEIDVHALRAANGQRQALRCFETGLPGSLATEEGLAMVAEERRGVANPGVMARQVEVLRAIDLGRRVGFRELYSNLEGRVGPGLAWGICLRVKRGLADPARPGVYAKDSVYLRGRMRVAAWLEAGGPLHHLYVGKVGIDDPVGEWLCQGWVAPGPAPEGWA